MMLMTAEFTDQQGDDVIHKRQAIVQNCIREQVASAPIPTFALAGGANRNRPEPVALFAIASSVAFLEVRTDGPGAPNQLLNNGSSTNIRLQYLAVSPNALIEEQGLLVHNGFPQWFTFHP